MSLKKLISVLTLLSVASIGGQAFARHSPLDGKLEVSNERSEGGRIFVDGEFQVFVPAGSSRQIDNIANGVRLVEFKVRDQQTTTKQVSVAVRQTARLTLKPIFGSARILNDSGLPMRLKVDGVRMGRINPNTVRILTGLAPGKHRIVMRPVRGALNTTSGIVSGFHPATAAVPARAPKKVQVFKVRPGQETSVSLGSYLAKVKVRNPFARPAILTIDGKRVGKIAAFETRLVENIAPGKRSLELRNRRSALVAETLTLKPGASAAWRPVPVQRGSLTLRNQWGVAVKIQLDKAIIGVLQPGETRTFHNLAAGKHRITSLHPWAGGITRIVHVPAGRHMNVAVGRALAPPSQAGYRTPRQGKATPAGWIL